MRVEGVSLQVRMVLNALSKADTAALATLPKMAMPEAPKQAPQSSPTLQTAANVSVLLAAGAALESPIDKRRREARPAAKGLDMLDKLHAAGVKGLPQKEVLDALAQWAEAFELPEDPELADIARDIELRVRVELAKHDRVV
ncbi:flagellar assembly protein FliX [Sphingomonas sp. ST-64]|uniref:Flagellar assembly protein FliX n=1 Tax=Sphingomonas plantiphila TaxID=3163295 RepID=A0ABW8YR45_9SPHN